MFPIQNNGLPYGDDLSAECYPTSDNVRDRSLCAGKRVGVSKHGLTNHMLAELLGTNMIFRCFPNFAMLKTSTDGTYRLTLPAISVAEHFGLLGNKSD